MMNSHARRRAVLGAAFLMGCGDAVPRVESRLASFEDVPEWTETDIVHSVDDDPGALAMGAAMNGSGAPYVIYTNFSDGTTKLTKGPENAVLNQSAICGVDAYPAWTGTEERKALIQGQLQAMMNDFNIILTAKRPLVAPYSMIMVGPGATACRIPAGGVAPLDCDNRNPANICFDFSAAGSAIVIAQEIGHTFGLAHTDVACDVMGASYSRKPCVSGKWGFTDQTGALIGGTLCGHTTQNSYQEMKRILGAWPGGVHPDPVGDGTRCADAGPPVVTITEPAEGAVVTPTFVVRADVTDDCGVVVDAMIEIPSQGLTSMTSSKPFGWQLENLSVAANVELRVKAADAEGKVGESSVFVRVRSDAPAEEGGCRTAPGPTTASSAGWLAVLLLFGRLGRGTRARVLR